MLAELDSNSEYVILFNLNPARISKYENSIPKALNKVYPLTVEDVYSVFVFEVIFASPLGIQTPRNIVKESYISSERSKVYDSSKNWV